jgi:pimeloyl-ACP methyl ester carboxylesterase
VLWGEGDRLIPVAHAMEWVRQLPNATLTIFAGAGHLFFHERAYAVDSLAQFFR